ncbi:probable glutamate receptor [Portunus trituberculatus]|uniref:probable glutamate receptor n=1 Tax=Portunus trituberculatus TaxID=210409 RepID=UPI001E1D0C94|nr:probable glutamate receptor [Portunus trituberculatus]
MRLTVMLLVVMVVVMVVVVVTGDITLPPQNVISGKGKVDEVEEEWMKEAKIGGALPNPLLFKFSQAPHLRVVAESWPPHILVTPGKDGAPTTAAGPMATFLENLAASLNFTYSVVQGDGYWGAPTDNGTWNGMIGMVMRKEANMGLGPFGMTHARSQVADFTLPIFREVLHILTARPRPQPQPWGFLAPFTWGVWMALLLSMVRYCQALCKTTTTPPPPPPPPPPPFFAFFSHLFIHYQHFVGQSTPWKPERLTPRLVLWLWLMTVLVLMRTYSGSLTSLLAVKTVEIKYDSLRDALEDPGLTLVLEGSTALTGHLQKASEGVFGELAEAVGSRGIKVRASQMQDVAARVLPDGRHAMFLEKIGCNKLFSDYFSSTGRCDFYFSRGVFWPLFYALITPLDSPLLPLINARILAVREFGIYEVWAKAMTPNMTHCLSMPTKLKFQEPYSLQHLWVVFLLMGAGIMAAAGTFLMEVVMGWK